MRIFFIAFLFFNSLSFAENDLTLPHVSQNLLKNKFIVFIAHGTKCPIVRKYYPKLKKLNSHYSEKNVKFVLVNASLYDSQEGILKEMNDFDIKIDLINDTDQKLSKYLKFTTTSQAVIYDIKNKKIRYSGAIDDSINFDLQKDKPNHDYVNEQLNLLLSAKEPSVDKSEVFGCAITYN